MLRAHFFDFPLEGGRNFPGDRIGDNRDPLLGFEPQANANGITRAGRELRIDG